MSPFYSESISDICSSSHTSIRGAIVVSSMLESVLLLSRDVEISVIIIII